MYSPSFERQVLVVEDNPSDERILRDALANLNLAINIHVAKDGQEALDFINRSNSFPLPDLVLLDVGLPKLNGLEVLQQFRQHQALEFVPIIMLTSSESREDMKQSYRLGANGYACKTDDIEIYCKNIVLIGSYWLGININHRQIKV